MDNRTEQTRDPLIGALFSNRYKAERLLERSSMSVVYKGVDTSNGGDVAIKLLSGILIDDSDSLQRFEREAQIARTLMHPNICALLDHGVTSEGTPFHILEYIDGNTLEQLIDELGSLDPLEALPILTKTCRAVHYLHSRGIVHRDLKPGNLMVPYAEAGKLNVKVIDFGVAKGTRRGVHDSQQLTRPGEVFGSLLYTAPERLIGQEADAKCDVYSLGCLIYEVVSGSNPFAGDNPAAIVENQLKLVPPPLVKVGVPADLATIFQPIVSQALEKNPAKRYQTAAELKDALERVEVPLRLAYDRRRVAQRGTRKRRSGSQVFGSLLAICVAALLGALIYLAMLTLRGH